MSTMEPDVVEAATKRWEERNKRKLPPYEKPDPAAERRATLSAAKSLFWQSLRERDVRRVAVLGILIGITFVQGVPVVRTILGIFISYAGPTMLRATLKGSIGSQKNTKG